LNWGGGFRRWKFGSRWGHLFFSGSLPQDTRLKFLNEVIETGSIYEKDLSMAQFLICKRTATSDPVDHFNLLYTQLEDLPSVRGIQMNFFVSGTGNAIAAHNAGSALTEVRGLFAPFAVSEI
jgi:hypothetical protein